ncbi:MAG: DUF3187 family protein [Fimbriimonadaceae bacterium]|jgi:hypothetical protein|nr:DUF3187 family protein [Fimbriimonadaceae bacterium]
MKKMLLAALTGSSIFTSYAASEPGLPIQNGRSTSVVFLRPMLLGESLPAEESRRWLDFSVSNNFRRFSLAEDDNELWAIRAGFRWREGRGEWLVVVPFLSRGGGLMDEAIDWWHRAVVGFDAPLREVTPRGRSVVREPGSKTFGSASGLGDVTVAYGFQGVRAWLKLPTGDASRLLGTGSVDFALSAERSWKIAPRFSLSALAALILQGKPRELQGARTWIPSAIVCLSFQSSRRDLWQFQLNTEASATETGVSALDQRQGLLSLGYTRDFGSGERLTVFFSEDEDFYWVGLKGVAGVGPDFALGFRYEWRR